MPPRGGLARHVTLVHHLPRVVGPPKDWLPVTEIATARVPRLAAVDGMRFLAATGIVLTHVGFDTGLTTGPAWFGGLFAALDVSVAIFLAISGFVLFQPWVANAVDGRESPGTGSFLVRRLARILPAYWLVVTVCLVVANTATLADWARHLTMTQIYFYGGLRPTLGHTWSLCVELTFYFVLPLLAAWAVGRPRSGRPWRPVSTVLRAGGFCVGVTVIWIALMATGALRLDLHTTWWPSHAVWFGIGIVLAAAHTALRTGLAPRYWRVLEDMGASPVLCWSTAAVLLGLAATPLAGPRGLEMPTAAQFATQQGLYAGIATLVLIPLVFGPPTRLRSVLGSPVMQWLGGLTYGLYLWHPFVLEMGRRLTGWPAFTGHAWAFAAIGILGGLALAVPTYYLVERPVMRFAGRLTSRPGRRTTVPPVVLTDVAARTEY